jgi:hypothetical protein
MAYLTGPNNSVKRFSLTPNPSSTPDQNNEKKQSNWEKHKTLYIILISIALLILFFFAISFFNRESNVSNTSITNKSLNTYDNYLTNMRNGFFHDDIRNIPR